MMVINNHVSGLHKNYPILPIIIYIYNLTLRKSLIDHSECPEEGMIIRDADPCGSDVVAPEDPLRWHTIGGIEDNDIDDLESG